MKIENKEFLESILERLLQLKNRDFGIQTSMSFTKYDRTLYGPLYIIDVVENELHLVGVEDKTKPSIKGSDLLFVLRQYGPDTKLKLVMNDIYEEEFYLNEEPIYDEYPYIHFYKGKYN